ncbi:MAG: hypothetical protein Q8859_08710, partial [Bacteroidota bacterium]|nr:hypothetical protein [Bacteroidota bacterium]
MQIDLSSGNQVQINHVSTYRYELSTTGEDPYLYLKPLTKSNNPDSVIFTFEYQCPTSINEFQLFFASPISEERSVKTGAISAANNWSSYSIDLSTQFKQFSWGNIGDFLRLDFGTQSGVTFNIRNMYLRGMNAAEKAKALERDRIIRNDLLLESNLKKYFSSNFSSQISEVKVNTSSINIQGNYNGS